MNVVLHYAAVVSRVLIQRLCIQRSVTSLIVDPIGRISGIKSYSFASSLLNYEKRLMDRVLFIKRFLTGVVDAARRAFAVAKIADFVHIDPESVDRDEFH